MDPSGKPVQVEEPAMLASTAIHVNVKTDIRRHPLVAKQ
jgi:hypothetical protein